MAPKDVHVLIPRVCYVTLQAKGTLQMWLQLGSWDEIIFLFLNESCFLI